MPEMIVRKWDGPYSYMVFFERGLYRARRGDTAEVPFEDPSASVVIQQAVNSLLHGGTIFLREVQLPDDVTFGSNILIVEDYQGERTFYSNNAVKSWWEKPASYIIWTDGTYTYAVNGHTGKVEFGPDDAATVIQQAINACSDGDKILIKNGTYTLTSTIDLNGKAIVIEGEGWNTVLKAANGLNAPLIRESSSTYSQFIILRNFKIDGNSANQTAGEAIRVYRTLRFKAESLYIYDTYSRAIYLSYAYRPEIFNCRFESTGTAIEIYGNIAHKARIIGNLVESVKGTGVIIYCDVGQQRNSFSVISNNNFFGINDEDTDQSGIAVLRLNHVVIRGNTIHKFRLGIYLNSVRDSEVNGNVCYDNKWDGSVDGAGIWIEGGSKRVTVIGNVCYSNTPKAVGINISDGGAVELTVKGNISVGNGYSGVHVIGSSHVICGNLIKNNNQSAGSITLDSGVNLDSATYCVVSCNRIFDDQATPTQEYGVRETGGADYNIISDNIVTGNATGAISTLGANDLVTDNIT